MTDDLDARLRAVERALVEDDPPPSLETAVELGTRVERGEDRLDDLTERLLAVEAAVQALQACLGRPRTPAGDRSPGPAEPASGPHRDLPVTVPPPAAPGSGPAAGASGRRRERR
ncbi:MAG: hypothetical protein ABEJ23_03270 [Haloarculaceae archaeon]